MLEISDQNLLNQLPMEKFWQSIYHSLLANQLSEIFIIDIETFTPFSIKCMWLQHRTKILFSSSGYKNPNEVTRIVYIHEKSITASKNKFIESIEQKVVFVRRDSKQFYSLSKAIQSNF